MLIRTIVVGLDRSERAKEVLAAAVELAKEHEAKIVAVRGVGMPVDFPETIVPMSMTNLADTMLKEAQSALNTQVKDVPPGLLLKAEARFGTAWQVVCEIAKEAKADLVVIGTHSRSALDMVLGTTAARITNHAHCSVMIVRHS